MPEYEVIPLWGAYPDAPWEKNLQKLMDCNDFQFNTLGDNERIGNELPKQHSQYMNYNMYPFFTCEMGVGIMNTAHRRLIISPIDGFALVTSKIGSGSNMLGYYVFAGGSNPHGLLTSMEENQDETGRKVIYRAVVAEWWPRTGACIPC